ncbi:hypothetical protein N7449_009376 [Penicillium cf. viridicatum]|uniref:F-box domain-containing protein n=1 Tax=Penicillium cf. viridicatum TaxID=2972119 RepID=A0A9W9JB77_9EURO|nr:hypothetical protein N7449_009376 [Penicillium cf. viridicatum]
MAKSEPETMASRVEECPGYKTAIQRQPGINAKSAINQVQNIPEILEIILAETDMRTLLISAQRVCRTWLNLINKSPSIQKALFFTPIKESEWGMEETTPNPLLAQTFPSFFPVKGRPEYYRFNFFDLTMTKDASTMARFVRDEASWRKMLVQQPPISDIGILHISHGKGGDSAGISNIPADKKKQTSGYDGLRMERLFELLLFSDQVQFFRYTKTRVYWSTEEPISFDESYQNINDEFHRLIRKFGLVFFTYKVVQCSRRMGNSPNSEELVREDIEELRGEIIRFRGSWPAYDPQNP